MKHVTRLKAGLLFVSGVFLVLSADAADRTTREMRQTWAQSLEQAWDYGLDQKDEAVDSLQNYVSLIQKDLIEMNKYAQQQVGEARERGQQEIGKVEARLRMAREQVDRLRHSDATSWVATRERTRKIFDQLAENVESTWKKLTS